MRLVRCPLQAGERHFPRQSCKPALLTWRPAWRGAGSKWGGGESLGGRNLGGWSGIEPVRSLSGLGPRTGAAVPPPSLEGSSPCFPGVPCRPGPSCPPEPLRGLPCWRAGRPRPRGSRRPLGTAPARRCAGCPASTPAVCCGAA